MTINTVEQGRIHSVIRGGCFWMAVMLAGCGGAVQGDKPMEPPPMEPPPVEPEPCEAPAGVLLSDIASVVDWINAMPKPLELSCFIASLPRPMEINATQSLFSAQPSDGAANPRVFIFYDRLVLSIVTKAAVLVEREGEQTYKELLELSFVTEGVESIKAEIKFPVTEELSASAPYEGLEAKVDGQSICFVCHDNEVQVDSINGVPVFQSTMLKPSNRKSIAFIQNERRFCNAAIDPDRCAMLASLTDHGELVWREFPAEAPEL